MRVALSIYFEWSLLRIFKDPALPNGPEVEAALLLEAGKLGLRSKPKREVGSFLDVEGIFNPYLSELLVIAVLVAHPMVKSNERGPFPERIKIGQVLGGWYGMLFLAAIVHLFVG